MFYYKISPVHFIIFFALLMACTGAMADRLRMATTTSTENSGLLKELHPVFEQKHGVRVDVIAVGTGQALKLAENGDVDIVFAHDPELEQAFVEAGYGLERKPVMHNDFIIIGPAGDPAGIRNLGSAVEVLQRIAETGATFISRGDNSGTHQKEKRVWQEAGIEPGGSWYLAVGQGMGVVLQIAHEREAYALTDRGTFIAYTGKTDSALLFEGDPLLFNPYHIIAVNPDRHPHVKIDLAELYIDFITSREGQRIIKNFTINDQTLFYPDAITDVE